MAANLEQLKQALADALGGSVVAEQQTTAEVKLLCTPAGGVPPFEIYVERMADAYQLTPTPALPDRINRAINEANERTGAPITRPERDNGQPPLTTSPHPADEAPRDSGSERRPPGPSLAGIGGSWD